MSPLSPILALPLVLGAGPPTVGELVGVVALAFAVTATVSRGVLVVDRAVGSRLEHAVSQIRPANKVRLLAGVVAVAAVAFTALFVATGWV